MRFSQFWSRWLAIAVLSVACLIAQAAPTPPARLLDFKGHVTIRSAPGSWYPARLPQNRNLRPGDEVQTHQHARARIALGSSTVEMGPLSHLVIPTGARGPQSLLQLIKGEDPATAHRWSSGGRRDRWRHSKCSRHEVPHCR